MMVPPGSILLACIDNSAAARPVLVAARTMAPLVGAGVEALHVLENGGQTAGALAEASAVALTEVRGEVIDAIVEAAARPDVLAVVVGARGRPGGARPVGHVAREVMQRSGKPIVVVPPDARPSARIQTVLVAMERSPARARYVRRTLEVASSNDMETVVVHVNDVSDDASMPMFSDQEHYDAEAFAEEFAARYTPQGLFGVELLLRIGVPGDELLAAAETTGADVIVCTWRGDLSPGHGRTVAQLVESAHVPLVLLPVRDEADDVSSRMIVLEELPRIVPVS